MTLPLVILGSAPPLKIFFDRLTDMTEDLKGLGEKLKDKSVWVIATGTETELPEGFEVPFARTAGYFGMTYRGCVYLYTGTDRARRADGEVALVRFGENIGS